jgi:hypothetical protein
MVSNENRIGSGRSGFELHYLAEATSLDKDLDQEVIAALFQKITKNLVVLGDVPKDSKLSYAGDGTITIDARPSFLRGAFGVVKRTITAGDLSNSDEMENLARFTKYTKMFLKHYVPQGADLGKTKNLLEKAYKGLERLKSTYTDADKLKVIDNSLKRIGASFQIVERYQRAQDNPLDVSIAIAVAGDKQTDILKGEERGFEAVKEEIKLKYPTIMAAHSQMEGKFDGIKTFKLTAEDENFEKILNYLDAVNLPNTDKLWFVIEYKNSPPDKEKIAKCVADIESRQELSYSLVDQKDNIRLVFQKNGVFPCSCLVLKAKMNDKQMKHQQVAEMAKARIKEILESGYIAGPLADVLHGVRYTGRVALLSIPFVGATLSHFGVNVQDVQKHALGEVAGSVGRLAQAALPQKDAANIVDSKKTAEGVIGFVVNRVNKSEKSASSSSSESDEESL